MFESSIVMVVTNMTTIVYYLPFFV